MEKKIDIKGIHTIIEEVNVNNPDVLKQIAFGMKQTESNTILLLGAKISGKAHLSLMITEDLVKEKKLNAGQMIREIAKNIKGGGGGQPFLATAGGQDPDGIGKALSALREIVENL